MIERQRALSRPFEDEAFKEQAIRYRAAERSRSGCSTGRGLSADAPRPRASVRALGIGLQPDKWEEEGLYSDDGMTLAEATALLPGIEEFWLETRGATVAGSRRPRARDSRPANSRRAIPRSRPIRRCSA